MVFIVLFGKFVWTEMSPVVSPLPGSTNRAPCSWCLGVSSRSQAPHNSCRELHRHEQVGWVKVVFIGFVDDPNVPLSIGFAVGQHLVDLSYFKILHPAVFHA